MRPPLRRRTLAGSLALAAVAPVVACAVGGPVSGQVARDPRPPARSGAAVLDEDPIQTVSTFRSVLPGRPVDPPAPRFARKPNVLLITADDAAVSDMKYMPNVRRLIAREGITFDGIAPTPICVPARASLLTGQYAHNHGAVTIGGDEGGFDSFEDRDTLPTWLRAVGYDTLFVGKYLNGYGLGRGGPRYVPPGWSDWHGSVDPYTYNFGSARINVNGRVSVTRKYNTYVFRDHANRMLASPARKRDPWMMWVNYVAPHAAGSLEPDDPVVTSGRDPDAPKTTTPAPRDRNTFRRLDLPRKPDMFEADTRDKPAVSAAQRRFDPQERRWLREVHQQRIEALQAVDEAVGSHIRVLRRTGQLGNTIVAFTSDNGYAVGEHNVLGKVWAYREPAGIPIIVRGPGLPRDRRSSLSVANPDLPVTFAAAAGATPTRVTDGIDVFKYLRTDRARRVIPIEAYALNGARPLYTGVRVGPWTYFKYATGEEELYRHDRDPYELTNQAANPAYAQALQDLRALRSQYVDCSGDSCPQVVYR